MSRMESADNYEYPPGLGFVPRPGTNVHNYHQSANTPYGEFPPPDRMRDLGMDNIGFSPLLPRSIALQDQEIGISPSHDWSSLNYRTPADSQVQPNHSTFHAIPPPPPHLLRSPPAPLDSNAGNFGYNRNKLNTPYSYSPALRYSGATQKLPPPPAVHAGPTADFTNSNSRSTLHWRDLEPWMDEEWAKRVCGLMNWGPVTVKIPHPQPDVTTGQQANNPGYCFLTFPSRDQAERAFNQVNPSTGGQLTMPNSTRPFNISWAASVPTTPMSGTFSPMSSSVAGAQQQYPKEYSIFVGDLAPETSNSDLVAVFRNPVLGLRNDREPKFIRPFLSCKSAKIMLDPVTGVSRGYGFVRFTDETDQQRALIEMHGLYCLSRPMRISPATAKFKQAAALQPSDLPQVQVPSPGGTMSHDQQPHPGHAQSKSVSGPVPSTTPSGSSSSLGGPVSSSGSGASLASTLASSLSSSSNLSSMLTTTEGRANLSPQVLAELAQLVNPQANGKAAEDSQGLEANGHGQQYNVSEESWKHHAQARAILGNLIGPNGEQLTSTDPYNTTVFVGGLSPLIGEDTLRSFFAPFGEIHYVKVPVGKHCGFVQFVRKADAERAIDQMQGFPIGGSRIRLSWGRSQYKAAQAAAQAAQTTAYQTQLQSQTTAPAIPQLTPEQTVQLLQKLGLAGMIDNKGDNSPPEQPSANGFSEAHAAGFERDEKSRFISGMMEPRQNRLQKESNFSPFSPDPNLLSGEKHEPLPHYTARNYPAGFDSASYPQDIKAIGGPNGDRISPTSLRPTLANQRYGASYLDESSRRAEGPISRPNSNSGSNAGSAPSNTKLTRRDSKEREAMSDLSGPFANLDLDHQAVWKSHGANSFHAHAFEQTRITPSP